MYLVRRKKFWLLFGTLSLVWFTKKTHVVYFLSVFFKFVGGLPVLNRTEQTGEWEESEGTDSKLLNPSPLQ